MKPAKMTAKPDPTRNARQQAHSDRQRAAGLVRVHVWVPADRVAAVKSFAKEQSHV